MKFDELKASLKERVYPIYLLEGEDAFFRERGSELIISAVLTEPQLNYTKTDGATVKGDVESFVADLKVCPFMDEKRIVEVREWYPTATELKNRSLKEHFSSPCDTSLLVIVNASACDALKKQPNVVVVDCKKADDVLIAKYIRSQANKARLIVSSSTCAKIAEYCQKDMTRIVSETAKLIDYSAGEVEITPEAVEALVPRETDYKTYQIVEFIARRNYDAAYKVVSEITTPAEKQVIFASLYYHIRRMFYSAVDKDSPASVAEKLGVKEYAVKKAREQAAAFTPKKLKNLMNELAELDSAFKSGRITAEAAFNNGVFCVLSRD